MTTNNRRFTSYDRSAATGLDYAINRTYDSKLGRFTQVDPIGMSAADVNLPQTLNLYTYCGNDPINHVDPSGLFFGKLFKWIGKIFRAINKILKWVVIAVVAILVVAAIVYTAGGAMPAFLGGGNGLLGILGSIAGKIGAGISSFMVGAIGVEVGAAVGGSIAAALYGVGAIANNLQQNKKKSTTRLPCPPNVGDLIAGRGWLPAGWFADTIKRALDLSNKNNTERADSGRYKEVGGWILLSRDGQKVKTVIKSPEAEPVDTSTQVQLGEPRKHLKKLLRKGWLIVGDFHTHANKISNPIDIGISNGRQTPGVWIYPDGTTQVYGPASGILGVGIPKHCQTATR
ncbi:MAG: RHS repeat-associated core domain-containing protein [Acidobacteriota bacterium]